jgi:endo-1,4-beta-xylanase
VKEFHMTGLGVLRLVLGAGIMASLLGPGARGQTLRQGAERAGVLVGAAAQPWDLSQPAYAITLSREFNMLEPEDALKWLALRPNEKSFDFSSADLLVGFALEHGMKVRGHNLVWGIHNPDWLAKGNYSPEQLNALLHEHIAKVVGHYRGKVFAWDVLNEALEDNGQVRDSIWYNQPGIGLAGKGTAYIAQAFRWAHAADPQALLFYNDGGDETINTKSDAVYAMVKDFKRRGVPIDGVGMQMHISDLAVDAPSIAANMERLAKLGVQVHITELDVALPVDSEGNVLHPEDLARQAEIYRQVATVCLQNPNCTALQMWGFTDRYSWIGSFTNHKEGDALPFDRRYQPKPAYQALLQAFAAARPR